MTDAMEAVERVERVDDTYRMAPAFRRFLGIVGDVPRALAAWDVARLALSSIPSHQEAIEPLLRDILAAQMVQPYRGWSITALNKAADAARAHLGLPSVRELNPDIAKMQDAAVANRGAIDTLLTRSTPAPDHSPDAGKMIVADDGEVEREPWVQADAVANSHCNGMDEGAAFCIKALAGILNVTDYEQCDGTEAWHGDVRGTLYNVLVAANVIDPDDGRLAALHPRPAASDARVRAQEPTTWHVSEGGHFGANVILDGPEDMILICDDTVQHTPQHIRLKGQAYVKDLLALMDETSARSVTIMPYVNARKVTITRAALTDAPKEEGR